MSFIFVHYIFRDDEEPSKHINCRIFNSRRDATAAMIDNFLVNGDPFATNPYFNICKENTDKAIDYLLLHHDIGLFSWEWKRRGSCDKYWIVSVEDNSFEIYGNVNFIKIKKLLNEIGFEEQIQLIHDSRQM
jgi:hypothetical protein